MTFKPYNKEALKLAIERYHASNGKYKSQIIKEYGPINTWDVSDITDFSYLIDAQEKPALINFNEDISKWDMSNATNTDFMFRNCYNLSQDLTKWNLSNITSANGMFWFNSRMKKFPYINDTAITSHTFTRCKNK